MNTQAPGVIAQRLFGSLGHGPPIAIQHLRPEWILNLEVTLLVDQPVSVRFKLVDRQCRPDGIEFDRHRYLYLKVDRHG